jgi:hypothetical protein
MQRLTLLFAEKLPPMPEVYSKLIALAKRNREDGPPEPDRGRAEPALLLMLPSF